MRFGHIAAGVLACALLNAPLPAASDQCAAADQLIRMARTDFAGLRTLKMQPGVCTLRAADYKCRWAFPGDAYGVAEAQAAHLLQCAAAKSASPPQKLKRGETAITLESDLSMIIGAPQIDDGRWLVTLRILAAPAAKP